MRKFILVSIMLLVCGIAFAAVKPAFLSNGGADKVLSTSSLQIIDASIYFKGATVGDKIELKKGTTSSGDIILTVVTAAINGSYFFTPAEPIQIDGGLYLDMTMTTGIGTSGVTIMYQ